MISQLLKICSIVDRLSQERYRHLTRLVLVSGGVKVDGLPLWISPRVYWDVGFPGAISVGDRCVISHDVRLLTHDYSLDRVAERRSGISDQELFRRAPIVVGQQAFVGMGSVVLPGVTIGQGSIVGAGSVVTHDVPDDVVVAGNPARFLCATEDYLDRRASDFSRQPRRG